MDKVKKIIDVVIPCYNVEKTIESCIKSLCNQSLSINKYNCYFINDYSSDGTGTILDKYKTKKNVTIIHHEKNLGLAATRNDGINVGKSKMVAFLDGDMVVRRDWLESFLKYFKNGVIAVMGDNIPPANITLRPIEKYYFGNLRGARRYKDNEKIPFQYMLFGNAMLRREVLNKCGVFDESIKKYGGEDTDLSARIWDVYPNSFILSKNSDAIHYHRRNFSDFCKSMSIYGEHNLPLLVKKHPHHVDKFAVDWIFSLKGRLLFNSLLKALIHIIIKICPFQIFIRYMVAEAVISGARSSKKFKGF